MAELKCVALSGPIPGDDDDRHFEIGKIYHFDEEACAAIMRGSPGAFRIEAGLVRVGGPDEPVNYADPITEDAGALGKGDSNGDTPEVPVEVDDEAEAIKAAEKALVAANARADAEQEEIERQGRERAEADAARIAAAPPAPESEVDLDGMSLGDLKAFIAERGLGVKTSRMTRDNLRDAVREALDAEVD